MATIEVKLKPWVTPNYVAIETPARPRQEGMKEENSIPVTELSVETLDDLAEQWLRDLYSKTGKMCRWMVR